MLPPTYPEYLHNLWVREKRTGTPDLSDLNNVRTAARYKEWVADMGALYADQDSITWRDAQKDIFINSPKDDFLLVTADVLFDPKHNSSENDCDDGPSVGRVRHEYWKEYEEKQRHEKDRRTQEKQEQARRAEYEAILELHRHMDRVYAFSKTKSDIGKTMTDRLMDNLPSSRAFRNAAVEKTRSRTPDHNRGRDRDYEPEI